MNEQDVIRVQERLQKVTAEIGKVLIGQPDAIRQVVICLIAGGHILIEGVPGLGKTLLVKALAKTFGGAASRIQFTPDLMPSDVTGHSVFNMKEERFHIRKGPVFTNLLIADEINRAPAKTQAALLEVMQEQQVTIEGETYAVDSPFMVLATQNPIEQDGTYPLPEAELDRFMFKILIDYPAEAAEIALVSQQIAADRPAALSVDQISAVITAQDIAALRNFSKQVVIDDQVLEYAIRLVRTTRDMVGISQGASPRASIALVSCARVNALLEGRSFATPDDVKTLALAVLRHRVQLSPDREIEGQTSDDVLSELLKVVEAPRL